MHGFQPAARQQENTEVRPVLFLKVAVDLVKVLSRDKKQGVQVLAVGCKPADRFDIEELPDAQTVCQFLNGIHVIETVLILLINICIAEVGTINSEVQRFLVVAVIPGFQVGIIQYRTIITASRFL